MAQIKEILEIENHRTEENKNVIHLYQEGTFYRAYQWSAWLCHRHVNTFKVTHRNFKNIEESVLFVGFPITSLGKYAEQMCHVENIGEKMIDMILSEQCVPQDSNLEIMQTDYCVWKESIPMTEINQKRTSAGNSSKIFSPVLQDNNNNVGILQKILSFPLENKTPMQCMEFISELKQQVLSII